MQSAVLMAGLLMVLVGIIFARPPTGANITVSKAIVRDLNGTVVAPVVLSTNVSSLSKIRTGRQVGYGSLSGGLSSALQGISSGYGYGYNNAVGLGGQGQQSIGQIGLGRR